MKKMLVVLVMLVIGISLFANKVKSNDFDLKDGEKKAILMVSFGTTFPETRAKTIGALEKEFKEEFKDCEVRTAFTSRIIMRRIKENEGITYDNPSEALEKLKKDGYTHILVQGTHIMNGLESETLKKEVELHKGDFKVLKVSSPLLTVLDDYKAVASALAPTYKKLKKDEATVFIGHGTHHPGNSAYSMIENVFHEYYSENVFFGTVEGYPTLDSVIRQLKAKKIKSVNLYPFMVVAGDHAHNDIAGDMKDELEKNGFTVKAYLVGLGENKGIRKIDVEHARYSMTHEEENMLAKKKEYANGMQP
jgi:sirohydrochlorin cobaltochelatase